MSEPLNPYESPREPHEEIVVASPLNALRGPSLALLVMSGLQLVVLTMMIAVGLFVFVMILIAISQNPDGMLVGFGVNFPPLEDMFGTIATITSMISSIFVFLGVRNMRRGGNYRRAMTAAILSCIPLLSPILYFGIPFGIWALVVLRRPEVRASFERR